MNEQMSTADFNKAFGGEKHIPLSPEGTQMLDAFKNLHSKKNKEELEKVKEDLNLRLMATENRGPGERLSLDDVDQFVSDNAALDTIATIQQQVEIIDDLINKENKYTAPQTLH